jgi:nitrate reductase delta subunit
MEDNRKILSMLGMLLDYPEPLLIESLSEIRTTVGLHRSLPLTTRVALDRLIDHLSERPLIDLQEDYVETFDRGRATSLYLFEHVHGESRERGQAMVDLLSMYEAKGLFLGRSELPDYLPVFVEFLAHEGPSTARKLLAEIAHIIRQIATTLAERGIPYFAVVAALLPLAGEPHLTVADPPAPVNPPNRIVDGDALDREWTDQPVSFLGAPAPVPASPQPVQFYRKRP